MNAHERGFLAFLAEPSRGRMMRLLEMGEKRRREVRSLLHNAIQLDPRYCSVLTGSDYFPEPLERTLRAHGAPAGQIRLFSVCGDEGGLSPPPPR
jgi:hypothetical protein